MRRRKPKVTKVQVLDFFRRFPESKSTEIARALKCTPSYVRAVLGREGLRLAKSWARGQPRSGLRKIVDESSKNH